MDNSSSDGEHTPPTGGSSSAGPPAADPGPALASLGVPAGIPVFKLQPYNVSVDAAALAARNAHLQAEIGVLKLRLAELQSLAMPGRQLQDLAARLHDMVIVITMEVRLTSNNYDNLGVCQASPIISYRQQTLINTPLFTAQSWAADPRHRSLAGAHRMGIAGCDQVPRLHRWR